MELYQQVTLKKGTKIGSSTLKADVLGIIERIEDGICCVQFIDKLGRVRHAWRTAEELAA